MPSIRQDRDAKPMLTRSAKHDTKPRCASSPPVATTVVRAPDALKVALYYGSEFFIDTVVPGPHNGQRFAVVRILPPRPLVHVTHARPFALP
jgi:hypothetical protein